MVNCHDCRKEALVGCSCGQKLCFNHAAKAPHVTAHLMHIIRGKSKKFDKLMNKVVRA